LGVRGPGVTVRVERIPVASALWSWSMWREDSYTVPNAKCPCCGEDVFFYRSPYGGAVFFDELGPPWPKHPCTITEKQSNYLEFSSASASYSSFGSKGRRTYKWQNHGWHPGLCPRLEEPKTGVFKLTVNSEGTTRSLYFTPNDRSHFENEEAPLVHVRRLENGSYKIAFHWPFARNYEIIAYCTPDELQAVIAAAEEAKQQPDPTGALEHLLARRPTGSLGKAISDAIRKGSDKKT